METPSLEKDKMKMERQGTRHSIIKKRENGGWKREKKQDYPSNPHENENRKHAAGNPNSK